MKKIISISIIILLTITSYVYLTKTKIIQDNYLSVLIIGDVGTGDKNQWEVARQLNNASQEENSQFVVFLGDNFYEYGITDKGVDDPQWDTAYANIYPQMENLKDLPWYGVIGNHDFKGKGLFSEFEYKKNNWQIQDFFWAHVDSVGGERIAFIHIDTNFLAYGSEGEEEQMKNYFKELNWTNDQQMLAMTEEYLIKYQDYDWVIVMGHHSIGYSCPSILNTDKLFNLLQKYQVDAYLNGHAHSLAFTMEGGMGMIVSGAGGKTDQEDWCGSIDPMWSKSQIFGFTEAKIYEKQMIVTMHFIDNDYETNEQTKWRKLKMPPIQRRRK